MTRTPDEIKKGLECCSNVNFVCNEECPYYKSLSEGEDCCLKKNADALALIQQLQAENDRLTDEVCNAYNIQNEQLARIRQLEAERDAAVKDLAYFSDCRQCNSWETEENCKNCRPGHSGWEWRGVQKEESDDGKE